MKKKYVLVLVALLVVGLVLSLCCYNCHLKKVVFKNRQPVVVLKVIDGDTLEAVSINTKRQIRIRLAGIDCPEKRKSKRFTEQQNVWQMSADELKKVAYLAKEKLEKIIAANAQNIYFEETPEKVCKREQRSVGVLWTEDGININDYMVQKAGCRPYSCADKWM